MKALVILAIIGILVWLGFDANKYNKIVKESELIQIRGVLSNQPTIEKAAKGGPWVPIKLKEYPDFKFDISGVTYHAFNARFFVSNARIGDTLTLDILKYDFEKKLQGEGLLRFSEKVINYRFIQPFSVKAHGEVYMTLKDVNESWATNHASFRFLAYWIGGIALFVGLVYLILRLTGVTKVIERWFPRTEE